MMNIMPNLPARVLRYHHPLKGVPMKKQRRLRRCAQRSGREKQGRIINIGSVLGFLPMPYMALYSATKHAVAGFSESLDHELRTMGIRVSVVGPAYIT